MPVFMFVGSCSIVISGLLLVNGTKNRPFDWRIGSILIKKNPTFDSLFLTWISAKKKTSYFSDILMNF